MKSRHWLLPPGPTWRILAHRSLAMKHALHVLQLSLVAATAATLPAPKGDEAVFAITTEVVAANPERFGLNVDPPAMTHWNTEPWHNQWWNAPNIEPITIRLKGIATGGSTTTLDADGSAGGWKLGFFDVFREGFFDGAEIIVYRFVDGKCTLLRRGTIRSFQASNNGPNTVTFAEPGPPVEKGDEFFITHERMDVPRGTTRPWDSAPWWLLDGFALEQGKEKKLMEAGVRLRLVADAPPGGGRASLRVEIPPGLDEPARLGNWLLGGTQPDWPRLREGKTYTVRLWLKHEGMADPRAEIRVAYLKTETVTPTAEWAEYTFDVVAAPPPDKQSYRFDVGSKEPGALFVDNVTIVEKDAPPWAFYPEIVDTIRRFQPSSLRLWVLQENRGFGKRLDDALGPPTESNLTFREINGAATTDPIGLHGQLELCAQTGANPWLITSVMFTPEENRNLIEYLAGPADSPYGRKRAAWGRTEPWTKAFSRILIEPGNEVWNGMFSPQQFAGRAPTYGAYSEFIFQTMKSSPYYEEGKYKFIVNGWSANTGPKGYGAQALEHAPSADAFDIAYYTGGWDSVGLMKSDSPAESWMNILTFSRRMLMPRSLLAAQTAKEIGEKRGRPARALVYEAGPGYTLPGPGKFDIEEQRQGKSLAHAVNALDIFMTNLRAGFDDQSFFMFKNGHYWASHNRHWDEHIAYKALGLRNALLKGDLIGVTVEKMVTLDLPETKADVVSQTNSADKKVRSFPPVPDLPLVDCYPFRDGKRHAIMLLSRRLDGPTRVTLKLPYDPDPAYTVHTLSADSPAAHNIDGEAVKVVIEEKIGMTRTHALEVPPHSVLVLINSSR